MAKRFAKKLSAVIEKAIAAELRFSVGTPWQPKKSKSGAPAWTNQQTGETRYQANSPGQQAAAPPQQPQAQPGQPPQQPAQQPQPQATIKPQKVPVDPLTGKPIEDEKKGGAPQLDNSGQQPQVPHPSLVHAPALKAKAWLAHATKMPKEMLSKARTRATDKYQKLVTRYGRGMALSIMGAALVGTALPAPGATIAAAAPLVAVAELYRYFHGHAFSLQLNQDQVNKLGKQFAQELLDEWAKEHNLQGTPNGDKSQGDAKAETPPTTEGGEFSLFARAPAGYTHERPLEIAGHRFVGGEYIPLDVIHQATPEEKERLGVGDFHKFLPDKNLSPELKAKIIRAEPGHGRSINLTKDEAANLLDAGVVGFVSAGRNPMDPTDNFLSDEEIHQRHEKLKARLVEQGMKFVEAHGKYGEEEDSFMVMVPDVKRNELIELGREFNQDSVIYSENGRNEMIYTTGTKVGYAVVGTGWKTMAGADDYYTDLTTRDGKHFKFRLSLNFEKGPVKLAMPVKKPDEPEQPVKQNSQWQSKQTESGGKAWTNPGTGETRYQENAPGQRGQGQPEQPGQPKPAGQEPPVGQPKQPQAQQQPQQPTGAQQAQQQLDQPGKPEDKAAVHAGKPLASDDTPRDDNLHPTDDKLPPEMFEWQKHVSPEESLAVFQYSTDKKSYEGINQYLRTEGKLGKAAGWLVGKMTGTNKTISDLHQAINKSPPLKQPLSVWRGINMPAAQADQFLQHFKDAADKGEHVALKGFISTTLNPSMATGYAGDTSDGHKGFVMEIRTQHGLYVGNSAGFSQREFLMDHGSNFKVSGIKEIPFKGADGKISKHIVVQMEHDPDGPTSK